MFKAAVNEFPFVAELPKREKSRLQLFWDRFKEVQALCERKGTIVPPVVAAELLGISRQRVHELMQDGRLERVEWRGQVFVTEHDLVEFASAERKAGRPCGPTTVGQAAVASLKGGQAYTRELKKSSK